MLADRMCGKALTLSFINVTYFHILRWQIMPNELSYTYYDMRRNLFFNHSCPKNVVVWGTEIWLPEDVEWNKERHILGIIHSNI